MGEKNQVVEECIQYDTVYIKILKKFWMLFMGQCTGMYTEKTRSEKIFWKLMSVLISGEGREKLDYLGKGTSFFGNIILIFTW